MTTKPKKRASTPWKATVHERMYRGVWIWVDRMVTGAPEWSWTAGDTLDCEGFAATRLAAMRAAERAVDEAAKGKAKR